MATIKLQPSGKVLIKDGKVSCGCCGCGCYAITIPSNLRALFENANISNLSAFGVPAAFFGYLQAEYSGGIENDLWYADFSLNLGDNYVGMGFYYQKSTGCLTMGITSPSYSDIKGYTPGTFYDYFNNLVPEVVFYTNPPDNTEVCVSLGYAGSPIGCHDPVFEPSPQDSTFTINGEGSFPFWYYRSTGVVPITPCSEGSFPPLNIVIT